jgi:hypothetical protein
MTTSCLLCFISAVYGEKQAASGILVNSDVRDPYKERLFRMLDYSTSLDSEHRHSEISNILCPLRGYEAQILRLLIWAREADTSNRLELLDQIIRDLPPNADSRLLKTELFKYVALHTTQDLSLRMTEYDKVAAKHSLKSDGSL